MQLNVIKNNRGLSRFYHRGRLWMMLYALMIPTFIGMAMFNYYPKFDMVHMSLFEWDGVRTKDFIGLKNFSDIMRDTQFWTSLKLVGILLIANIFKMWPCIIIAIVLHRIRSERWQYIYRVLFVIPMVIPGLVTLLIWKSFYDPTSGIFNRILNGLGLMNTLQWLDAAMPKLATFLQPIYYSKEGTGLVANLFGGVWGMGLWGLLVLSCVGDIRTLLRRKLWLGIVAGGYFLLNALNQNDAGQWSLNVYRGVQAAIAVFIAMGMGLLLSRSDRGTAILKWIGGLTLFFAVILVFTTMIWTTPTQSFETGMPAWLGDPNLVIPAIIFWGFPWVGTIGVLIYLAGLQNISHDVYEAGELDGVGPIRKMFSLELPLIMTQVRINLIFLTIGTLNSYGMFLLLLGTHGGPGNKGLVPGLYMYKKAFVDNEMGYSCALGMVMFTVILAITIFYQKYVKVDK